MFECSPTASPVATYLHWSLPAITPEPMVAAQPGMYMPSLFWVDRTITPTSVMLPCRQLLTLPGIAFILQTVHRLLMWARQTPSKVQPLYRLDFLFLPPSSVGTHQMHAPPASHNGMTCSTLFNPIRQYMSFTFWNQATTEVELSNSGISFKSNLANLSQNSLKVLYLIF